LSTFLLLVVLLFIYVARFIKADPIEDARKRQLSRIDFAMGINEQLAGEIRKDMTNIAGVRR
jgi:hypothetical protein